MGKLEKIKKLFGQGTVVLIPGRLAIMRNWTEEIQKNLADALQAAREGGTHGQS